MHDPSTSPAATETPPRQQSAKLRLCLCAGGLILAGCATLLCSSMLDGNTGPAELMVGLFFGVFFSHPAVAAAWMALGDGRWWQRLLVTLAWPTSLLLCFIFSNDHAPRGELAFLLGLPMLIQYGVTQLALWGLRWWCGVALRPPTAAATTDPPRRQFGIRQLMLLTLCTAVVLGIGRLIIGSAYAQSITDPGALIFFALAVAAMLLTLPVMLAAMLPQRAGTATLVAVLLAVATTAVELQLLKFIPNVGVNVWNIGSLNTFTLAWVLTFAAVTRWSGYRLRSSIANSG